MRWWINGKHESVAVAFRFRLVFTLSVQTFRRFRIASVAARQAISRLEVDLMFLQAYKFLITVIAASRVPK